MLSRHFARRMKTSSLSGVLLAAVFLAGCRVLDLTARQSATCEVHQVSMATRRVGMTFGMKADPWFLSFWAARRASFPHADEVYDTNGCIPLREKYARIYVCSACTDARTNWLEAHPRKL